MSGRGMDRAHSPIPPPREPGRDAYREDIRRPMARQHDNYGRRRRSMSPEGYGRRRHSPGRNFKRQKMDEYDDYARYDRRGSPRRGSPEYERGGGYDQHHAMDQQQQQPPPPSKPKSFKQWFISQENDMSPEEAQAAYDAYLAKHFGSELRASFERMKEKPATLEAFDPRTFEEALVARAASAAEEAAQLTAGIAEGLYDPTSPDFHQGHLAPPPEEDAKPAAPAAPAAGDHLGGPPPPPPVSPLLWKPERVAADLKLARKLMVVLDAERAITVNPLLPQEVLDAAAAAEATAEEGQAGGEGAEGGAGGEGGAANLGEAGGEAAAGGEEGAARPANRLEAALAAVEAGELVLDSEEALEGALGQLDLALTWLWKVHGVDYYAGRELVKRSEYEGRLAKVRTLRGQKPEEGEEMDETAAARDQQRLAKAVDERWQKRLTDGDPLLKGAQREEIEKRLDEWVESQIVCVNDKKWGNKLSNKFFLEKKFVVKHITNKHTEKVDAARDAIVDNLYWEAYRAHHEARRAAAVTKKRAESAAAAAKIAEGVMDYEEGGEYGGGRGRGGHASGGRPMSRRLPRQAHGMEAPMMLDHSALAAAAGGAMLVPAGMGPMGPIFIPAGPMAPMMAPQALAPMEIDMGAMMGAGMMPMMGGGGRGRGGRGPMRGRGRGGVMMAAPGAKLDPQGVREYYDLDAPRNNRAVLDYGDL